MKSNILRAILIITRSLCLILVIIAFLFPPFLAIDTRSNGAIHSRMGYFPIWDKPGDSQAFDIPSSSCMIDNNSDTREDNEDNKVTTNLDQFGSPLNKIQS